MLSRLLVLTVAVVCLGCAHPHIGARGQLWSDQHILSYLVDTGTSHRWMLWSAEKRESALFLELSAEPRIAFWDVTHQLVYYALQTQVYAAPYAVLQPRPSLVADLPSPGDTVRLLWIERATGALRVLTLEDVPPDAVITEPDGTLVYRLTDGRTVAGLTKPHWGRPAICTVLELGGDGHWKMIVQKGTKWQAGDTPGDSVVDDWRHEEGFSQRTLLMRGTCLSGLCREDLPEALAAQVRERGLGDVDDFSYYPSATNGVIFRTVMGDTLHATQPVFRVRDGQVGDAVELGAAKQMGFSAMDHYLLIADEYTGNNPHVIDLKNGTIVFASRGHGSVWIPRLPI
jgi:hypothetical protein